MRSLTIPVASLALAVSLAAGCDDGGATADATQFLTCPPGQMLIEGTIDGSPISLSQSTAGSGFTQIGEGEFRVAELFEPDPTRTFLTINWTPTLLDGSSTNRVTATLVVPSEPATAPFAGQTLCASTGSQVRMPRESENAADLQFNLTALAGGAGCSQPRAGSLQGCWRSSD